MKCALAAMGFINENVQYNQKVIVASLQHEVMQHHFVAQRRNIISRIAATSF